MFDVTDYGATGNGTTDDTSAIQLAITAAQTAAGSSDGATVYFPAGKYLVTSTLTVAVHRVHILGESGKYVSQILFNPATAAGCFKFQNSTSSAILYQSSIRGFTFVGAGSAQKIAIDLWDTSEFLLEDIVTASWTGNSGSANTPSIALRTNGRDFLTCRVVDFYADLSLIHI